MRGVLADSEEYAISVLSKACLTIGKRNILGAEVIEM